MISNADKEATPLDPIYAISTAQRNSATPKVGRKPGIDVVKWNEWRKSLPDSCWECRRFDNCYPARHCSKNPGWPK